jgi:hypothetical protein
MLAAMVDQYAGTAPSRGEVLRDLPPLMELGYEAVHETLNGRLRTLERARNRRSGEQAAVAAAELDRLSRLLRESDVCMNPHVGIAYTAAHEILESEFKLRSLLWAIETIETGAKDEGGPLQSVMAAAEKVVNQMNNFALDYENGGYPPRTMFGQLHRSIAPTAKALEPIIWARSTKGRWGRRILRLGIAAQHFNDVTSIHRSSELQWVANSGGEVRQLVVHPALTVDLFGQEILNAELPDPYREHSFRKLRARAVYWNALSKLTLAPRWTLTSYGGARLYRHLRAEDQLAGCLRFLLARRRGDQRISTDLTWDLQSIRREMQELAKKVPESGSSKLDPAQARG